MTKKPIIDQDMYILLLKAKLETETAQVSMLKVIQHMETLLEDIDNKLSEYDTTEE